MPYIKKLTELLLINFNSLVSSFSKVITSRFLFLTFPVSTTTAERSLKKFKMINIYLRTIIESQIRTTIRLFSIVYRDTKS